MSKDKNTNVQGELALDSVARREFLGVAAASGVFLASSSESLAEDEPAETGVRKGRIRQSVMGWCFNPMPALELARHCKALGMPAIEGICFYWQ